MTTMETLASVPLPGPEARPEAFNSLPAGQEWVNAEAPGMPPGAYFNPYHFSLYVQQQQQQQQDDGSNNYLQGMAPMEEMKLSTKINMALARGGEAASAAGGAVIAAAAAAAAASGNPGAVPAATVLPAAALGENGLLHLGSTDGSTTSSDSSVSSNSPPNKLQELATIYQRIVDLEKQAEQVNMLNQKYLQELDNSQRWRMHAERLEVELARKCEDCREMAQELEWWRSECRAADLNNKKRQRSDLGVNGAAATLMMAKKQGSVDTMEDSSYSHEDEEEGEEGEEERRQMMGAQDGEDGMDGMMEEDEDHDDDDESTMGTASANRMLGKTLYSSNERLSRQNSGGGPQRFVCSWTGCGKGFSFRHQLTLHERTHSGERPFMCTYNGCSKTFTSLGKMKAHVRAHDKPYLCHACGRKFGYSVDLKRHVEKKHGTVLMHTTKIPRGNRRQNNNQTKEECQV